MAFCGHLKRTSLPKKRIIHISEVLHENAHLSPNFRFFFNISSTQAPPGGPRVQKKNFDDENTFFDQKFFFDIYFFKPGKRTGIFLHWFLLYDVPLPVFSQAWKSRCREKNFKKEGVQISRFSLHGGPTNPIWGTPRGTPNGVRAGYPACGVPRADPRGEHCNTLEAISDESGDALSGSAGTGAAVLGAVSGNLEEVAAVDAGVVLVDNVAEAAEEEPLQSVTQREDREQGVVNLDAMMASLNPEQSAFVEKVRGWVRDVHAHCGLRRTSTIPQFLHFLSGYGGTGKSYVIGTVVALVSASFPRLSGVVQCAAITGMAAVGIGGTTLHSLFSFPVSHARTKSYTAHLKPLGDAGKAMFLDRLRHLRLLIIDEVSLLNAQQLNWLSTRLCELTGVKHRPFGGVSILVCGDLLQLPPVDGQPVFRAPFWRYFSLTELTISQRHQDDEVFAN